jgi:predicted AlkP superfamily pyrophosphatase or phosphodiesterase
MHALFVLTVSAFVSFPTFSILFPKDHAFFSRNGSRDAGRTGDSLSLCAMRRAAWLRGYGFAKARLG